MHSCIYRGVVRHRRFTPEHRFEYSTSWFFLDLDEVSNLISNNRFLSQKRWSVASYRRADHFGSSNDSMRAAVEQKVLEVTGQPVTGAIRLLTQLRHFGVYFSPLNVFYCFDQQEKLQSVVAEVSNTPWIERHCYVLWHGNRIDESSSRYSHSKDFHVSPFMDMESFYDWRVTAPCERLDLSIGSRKSDDRIFQAELHLKRFPLTSSQIFKTLLRRPVAAAQIVGAIYYQALRLWLKKCRYYPHPGQKNQPRPTSTTRKNESHASKSLPSSQPIEN